MATLPYYFYCLYHPNAPQGSDVEVFCSLIYRRFAVLLLLYLRRYLRDGAPGHIVEFMKSKGVRVFSCWGKFGGGVNCLQMFSL